MSRSLAFMNDSALATNDPAPPLSATDLTAVTGTLSAARFGTYAQKKNGDQTLALQLYMWNAKVSAAFVPPLHIAEICIRNAISSAVEGSYKTNAWHEDKTFLLDLRDPQKGYSPRQNLKDATKDAERQIKIANNGKYRDTCRHARMHGKSEPPAPDANVIVPVGKVIAELRFAFWVSLLTASHDNRIWEDHLATAFPNVPGANGSSHDIEQARLLLHGEIDSIRVFRNRIAHHEPIFRRSLDEEFRRIVRVVGWHCSVTAEWLEREFPEAQKLLQEQP
jgi:Abi-like protein